MEKTILSSTNMNFVLHVSVYGVYTAEFKCIYIYMFIYHCQYNIILVHVINVVLLNQHSVGACVCVYIYIYIFFLHTHTHTVCLILCCNGI